MSEKKTLLSRVDELFKKYGKDLKVTLSGEKKEMLASATTSEGITVSTPAEAFAAGVEVYITDDSGNNVPAPNGEHVMEDGSVIVVQDGVIAEIKPVEQEEEMSADDTAKVIDSLLTRVSDLEAKLSTAEEALAAEKKASETATTEATALRVEVAKLKKAPAAKSVTEEKLAADKKEEPKKSRTLEIIERANKN